jgi:hypothetical protein
MQKIPMEGDAEKKIQEFKEKIGKSRNNFMVIYEFVLIHCAENTIRLLVLSVLCEDLPRSRGNWKTCWMQ